MCVKVAGLKILSTLDKVDAIYFNKINMNLEINFAM